MNREKVIARVRAKQRRNQEIEQLERLHGLKEQGLITFEKLSLEANLSSESARHSTTREPESADALQPRFG